jgi:hypothetical protein
MCFLVGGDDPCGVAVEVDTGGALARAAQVGTVGNVARECLAELGWRDGAVEGGLDVEVDLVSTPFQISPNVPK